MDEKTIQAEIMKLEVFSHLSHTHTQIHSYTHNILSSLAPTADNSVTKPVTISRRSMFLDTLRWKCFQDYLQCYLHYIHKHTHTNLLF